MLDVEFPIYKIGKHEYTKLVDGILYIHTGLNEYVLDNTNLQGTHLSSRRRRIVDKKFLYRFKKTIFDFAQLLRQKGNNWYMDSTGRLFKYKKTAFHKVVYREILSRRVIEGKGTLLTVRGISQPMLISNTLAIRYDFAGLILYKGGFILYELSTVKKPDTRKKI